MPVVGGVEGPQHNSLGHCLCHCWVTAPALHSEFGLFWFITKLSFKTGPLSCLPQDSLLNGICSVLPDGTVLLRFSLLLLYYWANCEVKYASAC